VFILPLIVITSSSYYSIELSIELGIIRQLVSITTEWMPGFTG
jgi:hypothetical protein